MTTPLADETAACAHQEHYSIHTRSKGSRAGRWDGLLCSLLFLAAALASRPFVEMGLIDDFSYVKTAFVFAHTGHLVYNGWATAMLGAQIVWAALFIKLLGYSFFATRVSTLVTAFFCVWLTHGVMRRAGLNRAHAICGTLTLGLSPVFVPLSITFMTDISGLFAIVVAIYCCLRALESTSTRSTILWLVLGNIAGLLGGTTRQIAWVAVLVLTPAAAWLLRRRRGVLPIGVALWLLSILVVAACMEWFKHQLFSVPEHLLQAPLKLRDARELAGTMLAAGLCLALLLMPALAATLLMVGQLRRKVILALVAGSLAATWVCRFICFHLVEKGLMPWTGDIIDKITSLDFPNAWFLGVTPATLTITVRLAGSIIVIFTLITFAHVIYRSPSRQSENPRPSWRTLAQLLGAFTVGYTALLIPRGIWAEILDRYLLPLIVVALIFLLRWHQERISSKLPWISWTVLALMGTFTISGTHDWIASYRAKLEAVQRIEEAGVPRQQIQAGYEFDGITQIDLRGFVFDPRVSYPAWADIRPYAPPDLPPDCRILNPHTPAVHPAFFLSNDQIPCLGPSKFGSVSYRAWLPPFRRQIVVLKRTR